jgi:gliding motility-associatede transport system auxiliary component
MRWDRWVALGSAVTGVVLLLTTLSFVLVDGQLSQRSAFLLFAGVALVIVYVIVEPSAAGRLFRGRRSRPGSLGVLAGAAIVGVLIAGNVLASRSSASMDLTKAGLYTLSPASVQVARRLNADLTVTAFFRPGEQEPRRQVQTLLGLYQQQSPHVKVRFLDPDQNEAVALSLGVRVSSSIVLQYRTHPPVVLGQVQQTEPQITSVIQRLELARAPTVCWASDAGERDLNDPNEVSGYSGVADLLKSASYGVQNVTLAQGTVPSSCDVLVVLQLAHPLGDAGIRAVWDYLGRGGRMLIGVDPWLDPRIVASANALLKPYGAAFDGGLVVEADKAHAATDDPTIPVVYEFGRSRLTRDLGRQYVFFPQSTYITGTPPSEVTEVDLASSTDHAYGIEQQRTSLDRRAVDRQGPFVLMRTLEQTRKTGRPARIVAVGTSAMAENRTLPPSATGSNSDLFVASLGWLAEQDTTVAVPAKPAAPALSLSAQDVWVNDGVALGLLPLLIILAGLAVRFRRRPVPPDATPASDPL